MIASAAMMKVQGYIDGVLSGDIVACKLVRKAVQRHVRDMERQSTKGFPYHFDELAAEVAIEFIESMLKHSIGDYTGMPFLLEPWQAFAVACIFGWKRDDDGSRRFRKVYWSMGRKNGKSCIGAALSLLLASFDINPVTMQPESVAEVILSATKKEQSEKVIYAEIERMRKQSKYIESMSTDINRQITFAHNQGYIRCVGSDKSYDGLNPLAVIMDELHAWREHHRKFYDTMQTGSGSRSQPLIITVTTAGDDQSLLWLAEYNYAKGVLNEDFHDEQLFAYHFEIDEEDDVLDPKNWIKSNPNLHVSVKEEFLEQLAREAAQDELALNRFKRYHANQLVTSTTRAFDLKKWDACAGKLSDWKNDADAIGAGIDLGGMDDLCSFSLAARYQTGFHDDNGDPIYRYEGRSWAYIASDTKRDLTVKPFSEWIHDGRLKVTKYPVTQMKTDLMEVCDRYNVDSIAYDPYNGQQISEEIEQEGFEIARMAQNCGMFHLPISDLKLALLDGRFTHNGCPMLRWAMGNAVLIQDPQERVMYSKRDSGEKIDQCVSLTMAYWRAMCAESRVEGSLFIS